jgi:uncharacterized repeat protein (TIGR01451 family)
MKKLIIGLISIYAMAMISIASAQDAGAISLQTIVEKEEFFVDQSGIERSRLVPITTAVPGDEVVYTITFRNVSDVALQKVAVTSPVPEHTVYVAGSATGVDTQVSFSVDGGQTYAPPQELLVAGNDGKQRLAQSHEYSHIRWLLLKDAQPGASGFTRFRAVLK